MFWYFLGFLLAWILYMNYCSGNLKHVFSLHQRLPSIPNTHVIFFCWSTSRMSFQFGGLYFCIVLDWARKSFWTEMEAQKDPNRLICVSYWNLLSIQTLFMNIHDGFLAACTFDGCLLRLQWSMHSSYFKQRSRNFMKHVKSCNRSVICLIY